MNTSTDRIERKIVLKATRARIWRALTHIEEFNSWFGVKLSGTRFVSGAEGVGIQLGGAELTLGDHPVAEELRALGLPRRPLMSVWMERMHGRFEAPERV